MKRLTFLLVIISICLFSCKGEKKTNNENGQIVENNDMEQSEYIPADVYETSNGELKLTLVGHGSVMFEFNGKVIHVDPYSNIADYSRLPDADLIILTHEHPDHLDTVAINQIKKGNTRFIMSQACKDILGYGEVMNNGNRTTFGDVYIDAVPAYNMVHKKPDGEFYHPQGRGNGYVFLFGDKKIYVAGDTENIPEMDKLKGEIYIAFLPKNLPYTMDDDMFISAAGKVRPEMLYPYHFSEFDDEKISDAFSDTDILLLLRPMSNK